MEVRALTELTHETMLRLVSRDLRRKILPALVDPNLQFVAGAMATVIERAVQSRSEAEGRLAILADKEARLPGSPGTLSGADLIKLVEWAAAEESFIKGRDVTGGVTEAFAESGSYAGADLSDDEPHGARPIDPDELIAYLHSRQVDYEWVEKANVVQAAGGFSKSTFLVTLTSDGRKQDMVLRRDPLFDPQRTSVLNEVRLLQHLADLAIPVARPVWWEEDSRWFGAPVMATERLQGRTEGARIGSDPEFSASVFEQAAEMLAAIHAVPTGEVPPSFGSVPGTVGASPFEQVVHMRRFWATVKQSDNPLMEALLDWLEQNAPAQFARASLVHGDFGVHNLLVKDGKIAGVLDWEYWHLGDPSEDLVYARRFVEGVGDWNLFLDTYVRAGGHPPDPAVEEFYAVLGMLRVSLGTYSFLHGVNHDFDRIDLKGAYVGQSYAHVFLREAASNIPRG